jgi:hypothetical protein
VDQSGCKALQIWKGIQKMSQVFVTVVEEISSDRFIIKCACCKGSGVMSRDHDQRSPFIPCTVCNGRGLVLVTISGTLPFVQCSLCKGTGEQSRDCDGRSPYIICTRCQGVGAQPLTGTLKLIR